MCSDLDIWESVVGNQSIKGMSIFPIIWYIIINMDNQIYFTATQDVGGWCMQLYSF